MTVACWILAHNFKTDTLGAKVSGYNEHGGANQHWRMERDMIVSESCGLALDIMDNNRNPGAAVKAWTKGHTQNQMWKIEH